MFILLKLSARKFALLNPGIVGGFYGSQEGQGFELVNISLSKTREPFKVLAEGSYQECMTAAKEWSDRMGRTLTFTEWTAKVKALTDPKI